MFHYCRKKGKSPTRKCLLFLGLLCVEKKNHRAREKEIEINLLPFFFRRPYKIILQRNKNNEMKVMEQCIESGTPEFFYLQKTST